MLHDAPPRSDGSDAGRSNPRVSWQSCRRLSQLIRQSADDAGVATKKGLRVYHPYQLLVERYAPTALISWAGSEVDPHKDTLQGINPSSLAQAGKAINLALINISREPSY